MKKIKIFILAFLFSFLFSGIAFGGWSDCYSGPNGGYIGGKTFYAGSPGHCGTYGKDGKGQFATPWGPALMWTENHHGHSTGWWRWSAPWPQSGFTSIKSLEIKEKGDVIELKPQGYVGRLGSGRYVIVKEGEKEGIELKPTGESIRIEMGWHYLRVSHKYGGRKTKYVETSPGSGIFVKRRGIFKPSPGLYVQTSWREYTKVEKGGVIKLKEGYIEVKPNEKGEYKIRVRGNIWSSCGNVGGGQRVYFYFSKKDDLNTPSKLSQATFVTSFTLGGGYWGGREIDLTQAYQKEKVPGQDIYYLYAKNSYKKNRFIIKMPLKFSSECLITTDVFPQGAGRISVDISRYTCGDKKFSIVKAFPNQGYKLVGFDVDGDLKPDSLTQIFKLSHDKSWKVTAIFKKTAIVSLTSDLTKDWIWQTKPLTLTWNSQNASQCRRWIEIWNPFENVKLKDTSLGDKIPYDNWTSDWNDELSGTITTYPGSGPPDPQTGSQPRNWIGKLWIYKIKCKDPEGDEVESSIKVNVKPRPIWEEIFY